MELGRSSGIQESIVSPTKFEELLDLAPVTKFLDRRAPRLLPTWRWILLGPTLCEASFDRAEAHEPKRRHIEELFTVLPLVEASLSEEEKLSSELKPADLRKRAERLLESYIAALVGEALDFLLKYQIAYDQQEKKKDSDDWQHPGKFFTNTWYIPELLVAARERIGVETAEERDALRIIVRKLERTLEVNEIAARKRRETQRLETERLQRGAQEAYGPGRLQRSSSGGEDS